jgi:hypothetical protein
MKNNTPHRYSSSLAGSERHFSMRIWNSELSSISASELINFLDPDSPQGGQRPGLTWLETTKPEILVSCWMTPKLPEDLLTRVPKSSTSAISAWLGERPGSGQV